MNPSEKTPKELMELADKFYRSMQYHIASNLYSAAIAKALTIIIETLEKQEVEPAPKAKRAK